MLPCDLRGCCEPVLPRVRHLCNTHERKRHALAPFQSHKPSTVPIAQKAAALQSKIAGPAAVIRAQIAASVLQQQRQLSAEADELQRLKATLPQREKQMEAKRKDLDALKQTEQRMRAADDSAVMEMEADRLEAEEAAARAARPAMDSTVLNAINASRVAELQTFLGADRLLSKATLIYRATRDGFAAHDWFRQCGGKSRLLTIVRVKGNGFVFGAFTPFEWLACEPRSLELIADLTCATFLFSLVNAHKRAVKLRLKEREGWTAGRVYPGWGPSQLSSSR